MINEEGAAGPYYIWRGPPPEYTMRDGTSYKQNNTSQYVTIQRQEALVVNFVALSNPHQIGCLVSQDAAQARSSMVLIRDQNFSDGSTDLALQYEPWARKLSGEALAKNKFLIDEHRISTATTIFAVLKVLLRSKTPICTAATRSQAFGIS